MDRNNIIGIILMVGLYVGYIWYTQPTEEQRLAAIAEQETAAQTARFDSIQYAEETAFQESLRVEPVALTPQASGEIEILDDALRIRYGALAAGALGNDTTYQLNSAVLHVELASRGGLPVQAQLNNFKRYGSEEGIELWDPQRSQMSLVLDVDGAIGPVSLSDLNFVSDQTNDSTLTLTSIVSENQSLVWTHALSGYELKSQLILEGLNQAVDEEMVLVWEATGINNEKGIEWEVQHSSIYFKEEGMGRDYLSDGRPDELTTELPLEWMAFKQNFFSALVATPEGFGIGAELATVLAEDDSTATMLYAAALPLKGKQVGSSTSTDLTFYFGPNEQMALEATGLEEADRITDYGWWIFGWVNRHAILPLYSFLTQYMASAGLIILVITLIIKLALSPITWKNFKSSAKMKMLRPEIDALNEKHKDDAMAKQQATMALYRETGVNPLAGCIPGLLQMPILYAMFRFFPSNIALRGESFLWADDLGAYDSILDLPFEIPFYGAHVSGFTLMMAASTFFYMRMTMANQPPQPQQAGMPNMKVIQQIFPFMMLFFFNRYASGLSLYYFAANVISLGQMVAIKAWFIDENKIREKIEVNKAKPKKKKSGFQERLEQMQKEQTVKTKAIQSKKGKR
ncbi:MAG: membrane protein insertase YidC [Bacteroidetes bacterium]|jgi:YidC/Oxa1 family membrane protein insertase|nr:membrane protein insertase YidC [Bacteroidota bacterium]